MSIIKEVLKTGIYVFEYQALEIISAFVLSGVIFGIYRLLQSMIKECGR